MRAERMESGNRKAETGDRKARKWGLRMDANEMSAGATVADC